PRGGRPAVSPQLLAAEQRGQLVGVDAGFGLGLGDTAGRVHAAAAQALDLLGQRVGPGALAIEIALDPGELVLRGFVIAIGELDRRLELAGQLGDRTAAEQLGPSRALLGERSIELGQLGVELLAALAAGLVGRRELGPTARERANDLAQLLALGLSGSKLADRDVEVIEQLDPDPLQRGREALVVELADV